MIDTGHRRRGLPLRSLAAAAGLALLLTACTGAPKTADAPVPVDVDAAMPTLRTFHAEVAAIGQLAADSRDAQSLGLPQAGQVIATEVIAGRRVRRGDVLLKLATDPTSRNAYLQARNALGTARDELARTERLHRDRLATNAQLDAARQALADARAALDAQASLGNAQPVAELRAPADGVVTALAAKKGQYVAGGTTLVEFTPTAALAAQLGIEPEAAPTIRIGMPATIRPVYAPGNTRPLRGTITMVGAAVNPQTRLVDVVATLDGNTRLVAGTALSASIRTSDFKAWAVPRDALQDDTHGHYVFQVEHGKARRVDVAIVAPDGSPVGVEGKLDPLVPVITLGSYEVSEGDAVAAQIPKGGHQ